MPWEWLRYDWLSHRTSDLTYLWEIPAPRMPRSLSPSPGHTSRALGRRKQVPIIRSWLGGRASNPPKWTLI